jgi:hypothetical protein
MMKGKGYRYNVWHGYIDLCGDHRTVVRSCLQYFGRTTWSLTLHVVLHSVEIVTGDGLRTTVVLDVDLFPLLTTVQYVVIFLGLPQSVLAVSVPFPCFSTPSPSKSHDSEIAIRTKPTMLGTSIGLPLNRYHG